jgi:hypothetical protein
MGAGAVSMLRLPLSSVVIALLLTSKAGLGIAPLIIIAVVVAYLTTEALSARFASVLESESSSDGKAPTPAAAAAASATT